MGFGSGAGARYFGKSGEAPLAMLGAVLYTQGSLQQRRDSIVSAWTDPGPIRRLSPCRSVPFNPTVATARRLTDF